ncbi:MAG: hypothetical protein M3R55_05800, partial [Acidobacteriota bacterium]|nr:hypothetical protein [Acidobacteriota bacterium]
MRRILLTALALAAALQSSPSGQSARPAPDFAYAYAAWDRGDYAVALEQLKALVPGADEATFQRIALLTGELYQT